MWHEYMHKTPLKLLYSTFSPSLPFSLFLSPHASPASPRSSPPPPCLLAFHWSSRTPLPPEARGRRCPLELADFALTAAPGVRGRPPGSPVELASHVRRRRSLRASPARPRRRSSNSPTISPLPPRQRSPSSACMTAAALLAAHAQAAAAELATPTRAAAAWLAALASGEGRARGWGGGGGGRRGLCPCSPRAREERRRQWASARNPHPRRCCCWARHGHRRHGRAEASASAAPMEGGGGGRTRGRRIHSGLPPQHHSPPSRRGAWPPAPWSHHGRCRHGHTEEGA